MNADLARRCLLPWVCLGGRLATLGMTAGRCTMRPPCRPPLPTLDVPRLAATDRLVALPALKLADARTGARPRLSTAVRVGLRGDDALRPVRRTRRGRRRDADASATPRCGRKTSSRSFSRPRSRPRRTTRSRSTRSAPSSTRASSRPASPAPRCAWTRRGTARGSRRASTRRDGRWSATLRIPLASLHPGPLPPRWRANFYRIDRGAEDEFSAWSPTLADPPDFHVPERFGVLRSALTTARPPATGATRPPSPGRASP